MNLLSLAYLFSGLALLFLGVTVLLKDPRKAVNRAYALWTAVTILWLFSWTLLLNTRSLATAEWLFRIGYVGVIFIPVTYYHLVTGLVGVTGKRLYVIANYVIGLFFVTTLWFTEQFFTGHYLYSWGYYPKAGPLHSAFLVHLTVLASLGIYYPHRRARALGGEPLQKKRMRIIAFANLFFCLGAVDFAMKYGADIYPTGFIPVLFAAGAFAAFHFQVLDLNLLFRQTTIYLTFAAILAAPFTFLIWLTESTFVAYMAVAAAAFLGPKLFSKLQPGIIRWVDGLPPFKGRYEPFHELRALEAELRAAHTLDEWAWRVSAVMARALQPASTAVLIFDPSLNYFHIKAGAGLKPSEQVFFCAMPDDEMVKRLSKGSAGIVKDWVALEDESPEKETLLRELNFFGAALCLPVAGARGLTAIVCLGPQGPGRLYNALDIGTAEDLAERAGAVLKTIQAVKTGEARAALWAHDLMKPFTEKGTFRHLDAVLEGRMGEVSEEARASIAAARDDARYVARMLHNVVKPRPMDDNRPGEILLNQLFRNVERRFSAAMKEKDIHWTVDLPPKGLTLNGDAEAIEHRVLSNLLDNAMRHTPRGGSIRLSYKTFDGRFEAWLEDTGPGIEEERLEEIFKIGSQLTGAGNNGLAGLGLASAREVVEAHAGRLWAENIAGSGARFLFHIPILKVI